MAMYTSHTFGAYPRHVSDCDRGSSVVVVMFIMVIALVRVIVIALVIIIVIVLVLVLVISGMYRIPLRIPIGESKP